MGTMVSEFIDGLQGYEVIGIIDPNNSGTKFNSLTFSDDVICDYMFEFSPSSVVNENIPKLINNKSKLIIGSSGVNNDCRLYTSPSPRDVEESRMPSSA